MKWYVWMGLIGAAYLALAKQASASDRDLITHCRQVGLAIGACVGGGAGIVTAGSLQDHAAGLCQPIYCRVSLPVLGAGICGAVGACTGSLVGNGVVQVKKLVRFMAGWEDPELNIGLALIRRSDAVSAQAYCNICLSGFDDQSYDSWHGEGDATDRSNDEDVSEKQELPFVMVWACGHAFHKICLHNWLQTKKNKCPTCRALVNPDIESDDEQ